jgi:predicted peptidase
LPGLQSSLPRRGGGAGFEFRRLRCTVVQVMAMQNLNLFLFLGMTIFFQPHGAQAGEAGFIDRALSLNGSSYGYKIYVPARSNHNTKLPVILFLHGAGERGSDNTAQTRVGLGPAIQRDPSRFPAIVVMPQCLAGRWWPEPDMQAIALGALDQTVKEFNGDAGRIYLTGLSMGGYGSWAIVRNNPGKFAALVVVCGGINPPTRVPMPPGFSAVSPAADPYADVAQKVGKTPTWVLHGAADPVVPVSESRKMVEAIKAAGGIVRYSEYEGVGHNSWDRAYAEPELPTWLFSLRKNVKSKP